MVASESWCGLASRPLRGDACLWNGSGEVVDDYRGVGGVGFQSGVDSVSSVGAWSVAQGTELALKQERYDGGAGSWIDEAEERAGAECDEPARACGQAVRGTADCGGELRDGLEGAASKYAAGNKLGCSDSGRVASGEKPNGKGVEVCCEACSESV